MLRSKHSLVVSIPLFIHGFTLFFHNVFQFIFDKLSVVIEAAVQRHEQIKHRIFHHIDVNGAQQANFAQTQRLLRADWTRRDATISNELSRLGRNGVPVYVLYQKGRAPVVLSEILGVEEVRSVISKL